MGRLVSLCGRCGLHPLGSSMETCSCLTMERLWIVETQIHTVIEYSELEETHKDHQVHLLASQRSTQNSNCVSESVVQTLLEFCMERLFLPSLHCRPPSSAFVLYKTVLHPLSQSARRVFWRGIKACLDSPSLPLPRHVLCPHVPKICNTVGSRGLLSEAGMEISSTVLRSREGLQSPKEIAQDRKTNVVFHKYCHKIPQLILSFHHHPVEKDVALELRSFGRACYTLKKK